MALLKKAAKYELKAKELHRQAVAALMPLELFIEGGSRLNLPTDLLFTEDNSDVTLEASDGELTMNYSIRFSCAIHDNATDENYERYIGKGGWGHVGINFAMDGCECADPCDVSVSIDEDEDV